MYVQSSPIFFLIIPLQVPFAQAKIRCWQLFKTGELRIICATDAAGMGCDIPDVKYIISLSIGTVAQRWGRPGRDRTTEGVCLLLVPKWTFRLRRACLDTKLEEFINMRSSDPPGL